MYALPSSSSSSSLSHSALHPPETFPLPTSASTLFRSSPKPDFPDDFETTLTNNNSRSRSRSVSPTLFSNLYSRQAIFKALERGDYFVRQPTSIRSADDLDDSQLKRCFEILHACHTASDTDATLVSTRRTMEDFLEAVFEDWAADDDGELIKPKMDFVLRGYLKVGYICSQPSDHRTFSACTESPNCQTPVFGIATYNSDPAQLSISFSTQEPPQISREPLQGLFCPIQRDYVRFQEQSDWMTELRHSMKSSCARKVHRYNKRLAIWHVRVLVRGWARGSIWMGKDVEVLSFVLKEAVDAAFAMMGQF